jgi:hypothetical protein
MTMNTSSKSNFWDDWSPPAELNRSTPRAVTLTGGGIGMIVLAVLLAAGGIGGGIAFRISGQHKAAERRILESEGRDADGVVTQLWHNGGRDEQYMAAYRFSVDGRDYQSKRVISHAHWRQLRDGSTIAIRYLPADPNRNSPVGDLPNPVPLLVSFGFAGLFLALSGVFLFMVRGARRLLEDGRAAPAIVPANQRVTSEHGAHNVVRYQFTLRAGSSFKGRANRAKIPPGTIICVVYNPDNPRRNAPYPFNLVKVADR